MNSKQKRLPCFLRLVSGLLALLMTGLVTPLTAEVAIENGAAATAKAWSATQYQGRKLMQLAAAATRSQGAALPPRPDVRLRFSDPPTSQEIGRARVFTEPLVPLGLPTAEENQDLAKALTRFANATPPDQIEAASPLERFLQQHPRSAWRPSLLLELGIFYRQTGYFSRALELWQEAWQATKHIKDDRGMQAVADHAVAELAQLNAWIGRYAELEGLAEELQGRELRGSSRIHFEAALEGLWRMQNRPEIAFKCGPFALENVKRAVGAVSPGTPSIENMHSTKQGTSLAQLVPWGKELGMDLRMVKRPQGGNVPVPSVVHWKLNHYGAIVKQDGDKYLVTDATFSLNYGAELWITKTALDAEASGYFLVPADRIPDGWQSVKAGEGDRVWGKGFTHVSNPDATTTCDTATPCDSPPCGMPAYRFHLMLASLSISDTPIFYEPPAGPSIPFTIVYNQREASHAGLFQHHNLGPQWNHNWLTYIVDNTPSAAPTSATRHVAGGGKIRHALASGSLYNLDFTGAQLEFVPATKTYVLRYSDGSQDVFATPDRLSGNGRKVFLTQRIDPAGNAVNLEYDVDFRLLSVKDQWLRGLTFSYLELDPQLISRVTESAGRVANFQYDPNGRLVGVTDVAGMASGFAYAGEGDFVRALTTPYGTTRFATADNSDYQSIQSRWVKATDPLGNSEKVLFYDSVDGHPGVDASEAMAPNAMEVANTWLKWRNTLYWDKRGYAAGEVAGNATIYHWLHGNWNSTSRLLESMKPVGQSRIWFRYQGQGEPLYGYDASYETGITQARPVQVGRVVADEDGLADADHGAVADSEVWNITYGARANVTSVTDPKGRIRIYNYEITGAGKDVDLKEVRAATTSAPSVQYLLATLTDYNAQRLPLKTIDAGGYETLYQYNTRGQLTQVTNPKNEVTALAYNADGTLASIDYPLAGTADRILVTEYDTALRPKTVQYPGPYTVRTEYDNLDRVVKVTYPDNTFIRRVYDRLDLSEVWNRRGQRQTKIKYDANRRAVEVRDLQGDVTHYEWCGCGSLEALVDGAGHRTTWEYDVSGRVTKKFHDGNYPTPNIQYEYDGFTSRLLTRTDAKYQTKNYQYYTDGAPRKISYTSDYFTPPVTLTYDPLIRRITSMADGLGTTAWNYNPLYTAIPNPKIKGAGRLANIDDPWAGNNDTTTYAYDELGRVLTQSINGSARTVAYDVLGRVSSHINALGAFTPTYDNATHFGLTQVSYPNDMTTLFAYSNAAGDFRLTQILNRDEQDKTLSQFDYLYNADGLITKWTQQLGTIISSAKKWKPQYDLVDQLAGVEVLNAGETAILKSYGYGYDQAGNRTTEQVGDHTAGQLSVTVTEAEFNAQNQLTDRQNSGPMPVRFAGTVNEPAKTLTINGTPATIRDDQSFVGWADLSPGDNAVTLQATDFGDYSEPQLSRTVNVQGGVAKDPDYDANGNMTTIYEAATGQTTTYTYDGEDRLVQVLKAGVTYTLTYDGLSRMRKLQTGGTTKTFMWLGSKMAEERDATGATVVKQFFGQGVRDNAVNKFYTFDHLGSIRELVGANGRTVLARYEYDPYGRRTRTAGTQDADFGFTGHYYHAPTGLHLALYRAYDADLGRWVNRDPIGEAGGINLYRYVGNNPINAVDPYGLLLRFAATADASFKNHWLDVLNQLSQSTRGMELIQQAAGVSSDIVITPDGVNSPSGLGPELLPLYRPLEIHLDPREKRGVCPNNPNLPPEDEMPPFTLQGAAVVLAHELGHVLGYEDEENGGNNVESNEQSVRVDFGISLRPAYHGFPLLSFPTPYAIPPEED